jgi:hypothetical protein
MFKIQLVCGIISVLLLCAVFESIRRGKLMEKYAILWIFSCLILLILSFFPLLVFFIARILGTHYLTVILSFSIFFIVSILLHVSTSLSRLSDETRTLSQELAILRLKLEQSTKRKDADNGKKAAD